MATADRPLAAANPAISERRPDVLLMATETSSGVHDALLGQYCNQSERAFYSCMRVRV